MTQPNPYRHLLWHRVLFLCLLLIMALQSHAQQSNKLSADDLRLVRQKEVDRPLTAQCHIHYGFDSLHQWYNPMYHLLSSGMYVYQCCVSPVIAHSCAFEPNCMDYSRALINQYGLAKGVIFSIDRLMRCNRIALAEHSAQALINPADGHIHESVDRYEFK